MQNIKTLRIYFTSNFIVIKSNLYVIFIEIGIENKMFLFCNKIFLKCTHVIIERAYFSGYLRVRCLQYQNNFVTIKLLP